MGSDFVNYNTQCDTKYTRHNKIIHVFDAKSENMDVETVKAFGDEWTKFDKFDDKDITDIAGTHYFDIINLNSLKNKNVLDVGCGTGRWSKFISKYAGTVDAIDPSIAVDSAAYLLQNVDNVRLSKAPADHLPFADNVFDLVFSLGVLHHIPDTKLAMKHCVSKVKKGGIFLVYLYYKLDNRGVAFRSIFKLSNVLRRGISSMPSPIKNSVCDILSVLVYLPFIGMSKGFKSIGLNKVSQSIPLHFYVGKSFHIIRNDTRDRFGTPLEQRFSKQEITEMMKEVGLTNIVFSENEPYWHAVGTKA